MLMFSLFYLSPGYDDGVAVFDDNGSTEADEHRRPRDTEGKLTEIAAVR